MLSGLYQLNCYRRIELPGKNLLANISMSRDKREKRRHLRHTVAVFCRAIVGGRDYVGKVVNVSSSGMAVDFDDDLGAKAITPGTTILLDIERVGRVQTNVLRSRDGGIAFEYDSIDEDTWSLFFND